MGLEDLDVLQAELETLLVSVTKRKMLVETERDTLAAWQSLSKPKEKKASPSKVSGSVMSLQHLTHLKDGRKREA